MNATSRAILQTVLATDPSLTTAERSAAQRLIDGQVEALTTVAGGADEWLLVTQQQAAVLLSVGRATIWRMTNDCMRRTVEILPGTWR
jgi:hypothetical protein